MGIYINNNGTIERKDGAPGPAGSIAYDNSQSGLVSNNVQNAIDEVNERVIENISDNSSIELTATAAHPHAVGTSFILIGQLVKVTAAIEVGDTITVGTNVEPTSVLDLLGDVNAALNGKQDKLTNPLTKSDVVNNLTSDATNVPLSAAMGKSLNDTLSSKQNNLITIFLGTKFRIAPERSHNDAIRCFIIPLFWYDTNNALFLLCANSNNEVALYNIGNINDFPLTAVHTDGVSGTSADLTYSGTYHGGRAFIVFNLCSASIGITVLS